MIFRDNLFSGALGKLSNIGGSRAWTTPHTVKVEPEATIDVPVTIQGDLVAHSLDGRLWFYRRSKRLGIIALKWNSETAKLEYAAALNLTNNSDVILACGLDWVLTNNNIFMVADDEPYIRYTNLLDADTPFFYRYSVLRDKSNTSSGTDPLTGQAWGMREDNGNSDGKGYFMKTTHLLYPAGTHTFDQGYSLLPAVGEWQIFENFLVKRPVEVQSIQSYDYMHALRPLIPLEFSQGTACYGSGYNFDTRGFQFFHRNGQIWGRGFQNIGKVSLLPAIFGDDGTIQEYYLYIHPDFSFYPHSDFFFCTISTFDVNPEKKILEELEGAQDAEGLAAYEAFLQDYEPELHSFAVSILPRTWAQAKVACEILGGHLATSTSEEKNSFLASLIGSKNVWLGGTDKAKEGNWVWINGEEWEFSNWNSGEPNNTYGKEHYLELYPAGTWNDANDSASYYYICEWDYVLDENDFLGCLWQNLSLASVGSDSLYGFLTEQTDAVTPKPCLRSTDGRIFVPQARDFLTLSENQGRLFFDSLSLKGLWLENQGAQFLFGDSVSDSQSVECRTLPQWLAPAETIEASKIEAVSDDYVAAAADNSVFLTSLATGFNRQLISPNSLPLTTRAFSDYQSDLYRIALYDFTSSSNRKSFRSNRLMVNDSPAQRIDWQDIYKQPVDISFLNFFSLEWNSNSPYYFDMNPSNENAVPVFFLGKLKLYCRVKKYGNQSTNLYAWLYGEPSIYEEVRDAYFDEPILSVQPPEVFPFIDGVPSNYWSVIYYIFVEKIFTRAEFEILIIDPDTGQESIHPISWDFPNNVVMKTVTVKRTYDGFVYRYDVQDVSEESTLYSGFNLAIHDGKICVATTDFFQGNTEFFPVMELPANIQPFADQSPRKAGMKYYRWASLIPSEENYYYFYFSELFSRILFAYNLTDNQQWKSFIETEPSFIYEPQVFSCSDSSNVYTTADGESVSKTILFIWVLPRKEDIFFAVFRVELYPEVFDFYSEAERSKTL